jgi:hypothetical protein
MAKLYKCRKCGEWKEESYYAKRYGKICLYCRDCMSESIRKSNEKKRHRLLYSGLIIAALVADDGEYFSEPEGYTIEEFEKDKEYFNANPLMSDNKLFRFRQLTNREYEDFRPNKLKLACAGNVADSAYLTTDRPSALALMEARRR